MLSTTTSFSKLLLPGCRYFSSGNRLSGKVALVTGGAGGIGRQAAIKFSEQGAKVLACDVNMDGVKETVELAKSKGGVVTGFKLDVSKSDQMEAAVARAEKDFGHLNVVFNNAGIMDMGDGDSEETTDEIWDKTFNINVKGVWYGCKYSIPALRRAGGGSVINTASFVALRGAATAQLAYTSSKGAVLSMTRELAVIHARENMRFNALCPGPLRTKLLMDFLSDDEKRNRRIIHLPMGRFGEAEEMASAAMFLASDESSYVNGTDFLVDGGLCAAYVTPDKEVSPWKEGCE